MALTTDETTAKTFLGNVNGEPFDEIANPDGMGDPGYLINFEKATAAIALYGNAIEREGGDAVDAAVDAEIARIAAAASAVTAASARDAAIAAAAGAGVTDGDKGGITVAEAGTEWTVNENSITTGMLQNNSVTANKIPNSEIPAQKINATLNQGFATTSYNAGTITGGTLTPNHVNKQIQHCVNNGPFVLNPPASVTVITLEVVNGATAGAIDTSGFSIITGDDFTTTEDDKFICDVRRTNSLTHLHVTAAQ